MQVPLLCFSFETSHLSCGVACFAALQVLSAEQEEQAQSKEFFNAHIPTISSATPVK